VKLYISADLEGVWGVNTPHQVDSVNCPPAYHNAVAQLAREITLVASTFQQVCDQHHIPLDIVVNDAHYTMTNLLVNHLPQFVTLLSGKPKPCAMLTGLTRDFDGLILLGYHAKAGSHNGVLCHSFHSKIWDLTINGISLGEGGVNALYALKSHQVPVILASGDDVYTQEMRAIFPELSTVCTKTGLGFAVAQHPPWPEVETRFKNSLSALIQQYFTPPQQFASPGLSPMYQPCMSAPYTLTVTFLNTVQADTACLLPQVTRVDGRTVFAVFDDLETLYLTLQTLYGVQASTDYLN
jgi:D-amino peptidase